MYTLVSYTARNDSHSDTETPLLSGFARDNDKNMNNNYTDTQSSLLYRHCVSSMYMRASDSSSFIERINSVIHSRVCEPLDVRMSVCVWLVRDACPS